MSGAALGRIAPERLIDPKVLARVGNLELLARRVVEGFVSGLHRAAHLGTSTDFAEHRAYVPGDDIRRIDWRVFARTDRLYVKTFEAQTNADLVVALDSSASMNYPDQGVTKFDYARYMAATLVYLGARQRDRVGLIAFADDVVEMTPPATRHRDKILRQLADLKPEGRGSLLEGLKRIVPRLSRRGILVVISDFYEPTHDVVRALDEIRLRGHDVLVLHPIARTERDFDLGQATIVEELETQQRMPVLPAQIAGEYRALISAHLQTLERECGARDIDYATFPIEDPLDAVLFHYLSRRARLGKTRR
ncbi:MAG: DUF58 domain-containing protein [Gammaproteobacteria bacterium]|nr:DUF58 domain-containing protein [Gammaproteobacteria bacterium]